MSAVENMMESWNSARHREIEWNPIGKRLKFSRSYQDGDEGKFMIVHLVKLLTHSKQFSLTDHRKIL